MIDDASELSGLLHNLGAINSNIIYVLIKEHKKLFQLQLRTEGNETEIWSRIEKSREGQKSNRGPAQRMRSLQPNH